MPPPGRDKKEKVMTNASLIIIGTELTRGIIQDKHSQLVSRELTNLGIHMKGSVVLPDDGSVEPVLESLVKEDGIIIVTGGLGPTQDDLTRTIIAETFGKKLVEDPESIEFLKRKLGERFGGSNIKQAYIPEGFSTIPNENGTAPGFYGGTDKVKVIALPGPPREMEPMFRGYVIPLIRKWLDIPEEERDEYSSFITGESRLEDLCEKYGPGLTWGTRFQDYRISLYVSGGKKEERDEAVRKIIGEVGEYRIIPGDFEAIDILRETLREKGLTISCAESCSGGVASDLLSEKPGSSEYFLGSVVSYSPSAKIGLLSVPEKVVEEKGTISEECAYYMAEGVRKATGSDVAFSITGVAGPDESEGKKVGTVAFGFSSKERGTCSVMIKLSTWGRLSIRRRASVAAFLLTDAYIKGMDIEKIAKEWLWI